MLAEVLQQGLLCLGTTGRQHINHTAGRVDDDIHRHGWPDVTPVRPVVVAKFQLTLGVVLNEDAQLHATIQMPVQGVDLTGARRPLARRECGGQCHLEGANVFLATEQRIDGRHLQAFPPTLANAQAHRVDGLGRGEQVRPVGHDPQGALGIAGEFREILMDRGVRWGGVAQGIDTTPVGQVMHAPHLGVQHLSLDGRQGIDDLSNGIDQLVVDRIGG